MSYKILFVCHGNICRSPMAEFIMKNMAEKAGVADELEIASAATSAEEIGNPVYPEARRKLAQHGIDCAGKTARRLARADSVEYDLLIGMDAANIRDMKRICGAEAGDKIHFMLDYADAQAHPSPTHGTPRDFDKAWSDIEAGCRGLIETLEKELRH